MKKISGWMDFSNKKKEDPLFDISKSGTPGFMKDEMGSSKLSQVIALRTKCYYLQAEDDEEGDIMKCKGAPIPKQKTLKDRVRDSYVSSFLHDCVGSIELNRLASKGQTISFQSVNKKCISSYCDKRRYCVCSNHTVSHFDKLEGNINCHRPYECLFMKKYFKLKYCE